MLHKGHTYTVERKHAEQIARDFPNKVKSLRGYETTAIQNEETK